jgi:hypothetical protein
MKSASKNSSPTKSGNDAGLPGIMFGDYDCDE